MGKAECIGKKVLVSGATSFDRQNKIRPIKAAACETTNGEYRVFEEGRAGSRFELVVTNKSGQTSVLPMSTAGSMNRRAATEAAKDDVKAVKKKIASASERPVLEAKLAGDDQPVANVNVKDAEDYCKAQLDENEKPGRLPTNDEWEKMARGPKGFHFGISNDDPKCGETASCDAHVSSVVGSFAASGFGTYDTVGNVWEWTKDPDGSTSLRGGSWLHFYAGNLRADYRFSYDPGLRYYLVGFRCVWPQD